MGAHLGTPSGPQPNLGHPTAFFSPRKSPPSVPFAEVLLKKLGKTTAKQGERTQLEVEERRASDLSPPCAAPAQNMTRY